MRKPQFGTVDKAELTLYGKGMRPLMAMRMQRRKPVDITARLEPLKANPNKIILAAVKGEVRALQVFIYKNRPDWLCITYRGDFINIPADYLSILLRGIRRYRTGYNVYLSRGVDGELKSYRKRGKKLAAEREAGAVVKNGSIH